VVTVSLSFDLAKGTWMFSHLDRSLATTSRVADLLARMTPAEDIGPRPLSARAAVVP
jgi:hypothetical protein